MPIKDNLRRRKDGSYILASKAKESKTGDCHECGENATTRELLFRYKQDDLMLVKNHIEEHLTSHPKHESITPNWCSKCQCLLEYKIRIKDKKDATRL
ncbi:hypothetical protein HOE22_03605 [Candidatus Woesearchaeota archaeon]|nr:hypothetical protein [Candidatus Woesearchaeota archaeon]